MEQILSYVAEYLPKPHNIKSVSSGWYQAISTNDMQILEGIQRKYPIYSIPDIIRYVISKGDVEALRKLFSLSNQYFWRLPWTQLIQLSENKDIYLLIRDRFPAIQDINTERRLLIYDTSSLILPEQVENLQKNTYAKRYIKSLLFDGNIHMLDQILKIIGRERFNNIMADIESSHRWSTSRDKDSTLIVWMMRNNIWKFQGVSIDSLKSLTITGLDMKAVYDIIVTLMDRLDLINSNIFIPFLHGKILQNVIEIEYPIDISMANPHILEVIISTAVSERYRNRALNVALCKGLPIIYSGRISKENVIPILASAHSNLVMQYPTALENLGINSGWIRTIFAGVNPISVPEDFWMKLLEIAITYGNVYVVLKLIKRCKSYISLEMKENMISLSGSNDIMKRLIIGEL